MNVTLPPRLKQFVEREIKAGRFENTSNAICDGLRLLEQRDAVAMSLRPDIAVLGSIGGFDVMALAFIVMMQAVKSAQEDLRAIMESMKAINAAKAEQRTLIAKVGHDIAENAGQRDGKPPLRFAARGIGSENGYHRMPLPHPDPGSPNNVRRVPTNMHRGPIKNVCVLRAIQDELKNELDSMSEISEMESLRLQMAMDRVSKLMNALSNILKKIGDTQNAIVSNLK
ncbi:MAG: type II toxin-antitoxin system ParD family antitoxin [Candidatus Udaeobacter sp.]